MKKTNAVRLLDQREISYDLIPYTYDTEDLSVAQIAAANDLSVEAIFKTLVLKGDKTGPLVAVVPGDQNLDMKALAKLSGNKKTTLIAVKKIPSLTGYIRGGCSPLGMKKDFPVYLDESAQALSQVYVNAGQRGLLIKLAPSDLIDATNAALGSIARPVNP